MRRLILLIIALATLLSSLAQAYDVLILQSRRDQAYAEVLTGFNSGQKISQRLIVLSDYAEVDIIRIVREDRPQLILAVGEAALTEALKIRNTPVIALMALGIHSLKASQSNLTGIGMFAPPEHYCNLLRLMKVNRVGIIHNPDKSGWYLRQARQTAKKAGIELVVREVSAPGDALTQLASLAGKVDALWMLPDVTAVTRETAEVYFNFGQQHSVPVVSFAPAYLGLGAATVLEIDRPGLGIQANDMAYELLKSNRVDIIPVSFPDSVKLKTNPIVLNRLGITINTNDFPVAIKNRP